jgi:ribonuclease P protein component
MMALRILRKPAQFRAVYNSGRKIEGKYAVVFYYHPGEAADETYFGFVASKRVGNAVKRSRAKRLLREAARQAVDRLADNSWIVLVARTGIFNASYQELLAELEGQFAQAGLLRHDAEL